MEKVKVEWFAQPTDEVTIVLCNDKTGKLVFNPTVKNNENDTYINLFIVSDEEINDNDWYIDILTNSIRIAKSISPSSFNKKIVATTKREMFLPGISSKSISMFVENNNNMKQVEFYIERLRDDFWCYIDPNGEPDYNIALDNDNCIEVKVNKTFWTRLEVEELLRKLDVENQYSPEDPCKFDIDEWIRENLN